MKCTGSEVDGEGKVRKCRRMVKEKFEKGKRGREGKGQEM